MGPAETRAGKGPVPEPGSVTPQLIIRLAMSPALLAPVWRHSHWSVALCLTLLFVRAELQDWTVRKSKVDVHAMDPHSLQYSRIAEALERALRSGEAQGLKNAVRGRS